MSDSDITTFTEVELTAESYAALTYERPILPPHWGWRTNSGKPNPEHMRPQSAFYEVRSDG
jgi:hypothetical protein